MKTNDVVKMVEFIQFLADFTTEYEVYNEYSVTMNMRNANMLIDGNRWEDVVSEIFGDYEVNFLYADDNWVTVEFVNAKEEKLEECKNIMKKRESEDTNMNDTAFYKELIKRQAEELMGLTIIQDREEDARIGFWVERDDKVCAKGLSFILDEDFVGIEIMLIKPDYRKSEIMKKSAEYEDIYEKAWIFDDKVAVYGQAMQNSVFLQNGFDIFEGLINPVWEIISDEFLVGVKE